MIKINKKDSLLSVIVEPILEMPFYQEIKDGKDLHIYGVSSEREYDVVIPQEFKDSSKLKNFLDHRGLNVRIGSYWSMSETYNYQVIGLGHNLRKNRKQEARLVINLAYLALQEKLDYGDF